MVVEVLDHVLLTKLILQQVEEVTCSECCKYFSSPETASCGHTLCHSCWKGRRTCHVCAVPIVKKALKVNIPLQNFTEHVHALVDKFEKLFNLKLAEVSLEILDNMQSEDPTKNVKEWLASSQNHFSAPVISSQDTQDCEPVKHMELSKSNLQVHTHKKRIESPKNVVQPPQPQDDWDKIEVVPDTEEYTTKPKQLKDHRVESMDFEPFFLDEYEYTSDNPRRSSRKKEQNEDFNPPIRDMSVDKITANSPRRSSRKKQGNPPTRDLSVDKTTSDSPRRSSRKKEGNGDSNPPTRDWSVDKIISDSSHRSSRKKEENGDSNPPTRDVSVDKISAKNSSDTKSHKSKQIWGNVKKMKKEFSKLNRKNKSKLNVSIEMAKRAAASKQKISSPPQTDSEKKLLSIDDNTPVVECVGRKNEVTPERSLQKDRSLNSGSLRKDDEKIIEICDNNYSALRNRECVNELNLENRTSGQKGHSQAKQNSDNLHEVELPHSFETQSRNDKSMTPKCTNLKEAMASSSTTEVKPVNMPFVKKSALCKQTKSTDQNDVKITQKEIESNSVITSTDDIEISIRIGNTVTNIVIKNKRNDVQCKVNTDQGIQASLGPYGLIEKTDAGNSPIQELNVQNIELNIEENNKVAVNKSISTKKNTASADTATAQFEITDSMEKELSDVMECLERKRKKTLKSQNSQLLPKVVENDNAPPNQKASQISENVGTKVPEVETLEKQITDVLKDKEDLDDVDIFNSGSVKDGNGNVNILKDVEKAPSEILMSTVKSKKSQKSADKRGRESDDNEQPSSKKIKIDLHKIDEDKEDVSARVPDNPTKEMQDSENMNYDVIMSQVFANIDADIGTGSKNENIEVFTQVLKEKSNEIGLHKPTLTHTSQIIDDTPNAPSRKNNSDIEMRNVSELKEVNQKYSENVFSMLEKDSQPLEKDVSEQTNKKVPTSTQQHIDNLLTPGMCRDLVATGDSQASSLMDKMDDEIVMLEPDIGTPNVENDDSDKSIVEETPQKNSFAKPKVIEVKTKSSNQKEQSQKAISPAHKITQSQESRISDSQIIRSIINISDTSTKDATAIEIGKRKGTLETPLTINKFVNHIKHNSTPVARKSLNFERNTDDTQQTLCPTTTQEKEFLADAFKQTPTSPVKRPLTLKNKFNRKNRKYFVAGSCLTTAETKTLKVLCQERGWTYLDKYSKELTHLVVGVDEENKSQRSVKYMCALAASKWIVSFTWIEKCLQLKTDVDELPYEALDACGEPGPRRSRTAFKKIFEGMSFYCMPPFSVLDLDALKQMLEAAGGRVVDDPQGVKVTQQSGSQVLLLLAEPEHTQEDRFVYLAMEHSVVPVNYEWALNCLGTYSLSSIHDHLLCPSSLLPLATSEWPAVLLLHEDEDYS